MSLDGLSPCAPARVKALVLPLGNIKESEFSKFLRRLRRENVVRLGDVSPDGRPNRTMFSPLAFADGLVVYDMSTSLPPASHFELAPFETYRIPLLSIGVVDWKEYQRHNALADEGRNKREHIASKMSKMLDRVRECNTSALAHRLLLFDCDLSLEGLPQDVIIVPPRSKMKTTTMKTIMCDMTANVLGEMSIYGRSFQARSTIETPRAPQSSLPARGASPLSSHRPANTRPVSMAIQSESSSPVFDEKHNHRLSMPAHMSSNPELTYPQLSSQPNSPLHNARTPPSRSEENLPVFASSPPKDDNTEVSGKEPNGPTGFASSANHLGEREAYRGKARVGLVLGSLYLLSGRWPDAIRELSFSATMARSNSDYVWQAKAMDHLIVCLFMCAWAGMDFKIPDVLRPASEMLQNSTGKGSKHSPSNSAYDITLSRSADPDKLNATLAAFAKLLPDLVHNVLNLYGRAYTFTDDKLASPSFEHSTIRLVKLMTQVHRAQGEINREVLGNLIVGNSTSVSLGTDFGQNSANRKPELAQLLLRAYPNPSSDSSMTASDRLLILSAIVNCLLELGSYRKVAAVVREIMTHVLPSLVQARKDHAAEMGIHPAASLAALNASQGPLTDSSALPTDGTADGMQAFLDFACRMLGISHQDNAINEIDQPVPRISKAPNDTLRSAICAAYGAQNLKLDLLWASISICEALPDVAGVLRYAALLLRTASNMVAPAPESSNGAPVLSLDEQEKLANTITRTIGAAQQLGINSVRAEYWDDFLIRNVEMIDEDQTDKLIPHKSSELSVATQIEAATTKDPFIHNPFLKPKSTSKESILVAGERIAFRLMLQNLYDFEVLVEQISVIAEGVELECLPSTFAVGPYRTQTMLLHATPLEHGSLKVTGCLVKIQGCAERIFPIFKDPWALPLDAKGKNLNCKTTGSLTERPGAESREPPEKNTPFIGPQKSIMSFKVVGRQPSLSLNIDPSPQTTFSVLEGEKKIIQFSLHNASTVSADLVLSSFTDSCSLRAQEALASSGISTSELFELEKDLAERPALQLLRHEQAQDLVVEASASLQVDIEVLGKDGLDGGRVQFDYGHLGKPRSEITEQFYTRQLSIPLAITVNPTLRLVKSQILPSDEVKLHLSTREVSVLDEAHTIPAEQGFSPSLCILLLDIQNAAQSALTLHLQISPSIASQGKSARVFHHSIPPEAISRIPVVLPRFYLPDLDSVAPIPSLNPATKRQFVVSSASTSMTAQREERELFWYREKILSVLSATWTEDSTGRKGSVDIRGGFMMTADMLRACRLDALHISMGLALDKPTDKEAFESVHMDIRQLGSYRFEAQTSKLVRLQTTLLNRSSRPIRTLLRLQPSLANFDNNVALDLHRKLLVHGNKQRVLSELNPGEQRVIELAFVPLSPGVFEWNASVEELREVNNGSRAAQRDHVMDINSKKSRPRAKTGELDLSIMQEGRRTWFAERSCVVVARDLSVQEHEAA